MPFEPLHHILGVDILYVGVLGYHQLIVGDAKFDRGLRTNIPINDVNDNFNDF